MKKALTVFCRGEEDGSVARKAARTYLVIPKNRHVYLILPDGLEEKQVLELCEEIRAMEDKDFVIYVFVRRGDDLAERLLDVYPNRETVQPVVIGSKAAQFIRAADVVLTKAGILTVPEEAEDGDLGRWHILCSRSDNLRETILKALEAARAKARQEGQQ